MKILCISDTHLENKIYNEINHKFPNMDYYIHCGDSSLTKKDPLLSKYIIVKGNHDEENFPLEVNVNIGDYRCLIVHGHKHGVYAGYKKLLMYMKEQDIDICFHGHTHIPSMVCIDDKYIINPGSAMMNRANYGYGTYVILDIEIKKIEVTYYHHTTHQECTHEVIRDGEKLWKEIRNLR